LLGLMAQRLPEESLSLGFIPIPSLSLHANGHEELSFGSCASMAMPCAFFGADHVLADGTDKLVILVQLKQLRFSGRVALEGEKVFLRIDSDGGHAASQSFRKTNGYANAKPKSD